MFYRLYNKICHLILTLRVSILSIFITLLIITVLAITTFNSIHFTKSMTYIAISLMEKTSDRVLHLLTDQANLGADRGKFSASLIEQGILKNTEDQLVPFTIDLTKSLPLVDGAYWGNEDGDFVYSKQHDDDSITTEYYNHLTVPVSRSITKWDKDGHIINRVTTSDINYDPRERPWYQQAKKEGKTIWTDIYHYKLQHVLGVTVASPTVHNGKFFGAFGIDINLKYLSDFISKQRIRENGFCFIITREGKLLVHPNTEIFNKAKNMKGQFINVHKTSIPLISQSLEKYIQSGEKNNVFSIDFNGETYMISYKPVASFKEYGWLIGVIVPRADFTKELQAIYMTTLAVGAVVLLLAMIFISGLISRIVKPLNLLVQETENIKLFNLEGEVEVKSRIKEIVHLRDAVHSMKNGLKLFQKYIPKVLVKQLIESGEDVRVGGVRKKLTIFFSDIQGFASITEKTDPNDFIIQMGEYFEELTNIIIEEKGTIDKYIGDSIMAFWGSPLPEMTPSHHAARAALDCQVKLGMLNKKWISEGQNPLITRIGIHTGEAIVGNLGSSERVNYTAIGDSINIASRLEAINKNYKTNIIVSGAVYKEIKDKFVMRFVDRVIVKGRTKGINIYELLGDDIRKIKFDFDSYRPVFSKGFSAYKQQNWDEAMSYFETCLEIYPEDNIAPIFIGRCTQYKFIPPDEEWVNMWVKAK